MGCGMEEDTVGQVVHHGSYDTACLNRSYDIACLNGSYDTACLNADGNDHNNSIY